MTKQEFLEYVTCRDDAEWAHPELQEEYYAKGFDLDAAELYDPDLSPDQRKEKAESLKALLPTVELNEERLTIVEVPGCPEEPDATVKTYFVRPKSKKKKLPVLFKIVPGGLVLSDPALFPLDDYAKKFKAVVVAFQYRTLSDDNGAYPAAINDCHAVYDYLVKNAEELGINPERIVIEGENAGGQLALAFCHRLKRYGYKARGCVVSVPTVDDRPIYESSKLNGKGWTGAVVEASGKAWLNGYDGAPAPEAYANYATIEDCIGLTPTFIHTTEADPNSDPVMDYTVKLKAAGVYTELHLWGGANHTALSAAAACGADLEYSQYIQDIYDADIKDCFKYDFGRSFLKDEANLPAPETKVSWYDIETPANAYSINSPMKQIVKNPRALAVVLKALGPRLMEQQKAQKEAAPAEDAPEAAPKEKKPLKETLAGLKDLVGMMGAMTPLRFTDSMDDITNAELMDMNAKLNRIHKK